MTRALTGGELIKMRTDGQATRLGMTFHPTVIVFACRVNGDPASDDQIAEIAYDTVTEGAFGDVLVDQTILIGTSAGAYDVGFCRVRKAATDTVLYLNEMSEIVWSDDLYVTVIDVFDIWPRHVRVTESGGTFTTHMDYDVVYSDQHLNCRPVPVLGSHVITELVGATVDVTCFDGSDSYVPGSTISAYSWAAPGASATSDMNTATPTITYDAAGWYRVACTVTATNGKSFIGYRRVYVYDDAHPPLWAFQLSGGAQVDWKRGGWSFRCTVHDEATLSEIRDRTLVMLFAEDFFEGTKQAVGVEAGRENIVVVGWIVGESISWNPINGTVDFEVQGPHWWFSKIEGFPSGMDDVGSATPASWLEMGNMTVDDTLWHLLHWRTTAPRTMDILLTGDSTSIGMYQASSANLWQQITAGSEETILAHPCCDHLARLFIQVDSQFLPVGDRAAIPVVMDIAKGDWRARDQVRIERRVVPVTGQLDLSGVVWTSATLSGIAMFGLAPGHVMKWHGGIEPKPRLALTDQAQTNLLSGLILGNLNNEYPAINVPFAMSNRAWDVCPRQYGRITVEAGDTPRGIALTDFKIIPRRVSLRMHEADGGGALLPDVEFEGYTTEVGGITGDPPPEPPAPPPPPSPPPPPLPPTPPVGYGMIVLSQSELGRSMDFFEAEDPHWVDILGDITGTLYNIALGSSNQLWATSSDGLWYCADAAEETPAWSCIMTDGDAETASSLTGHFQSVDVDGATVYAPWHIDGYAGNILGGYFTGNAGGVNFVAFVANNVAVHGTAGVGYVMDASEGVIACSGTIVGPTTGWIHSIGVGNTNFPGEYSMVCARDGFCEGWSGDIYEGYAPVGAYDAGNYFGVDVLDGSPLYVDDASQELRRATVVLADGNAVFGAGGVVSGRAIYGPQADADSIVWITCAAVAGVETLIVWSEDGFANFSDKTGDFYAEVDHWAGVSDAGGGGNAAVISFEY